MYSHCSFETLKNKTLALENSRRLNYLGKEPFLVYHKHPCARQEAACLKQPYQSFFFGEDLPLLLKFKTNGGF
jgi:hypothetical protein